MSHSNFEADKIIGLFLVHLQQLRCIAIEEQDKNNKRRKNNKVLFGHLLFWPYRENKKEIPKLKIRSYLIF